MKSTHYKHHRTPLLALALLALAVALPAAARAANEGQADLDKATELKVGAQSTGDLSDVIQLCESALKKGLDKDNTTFANDLMASALVQRGSITAAKIFGDESSTARLNLQGDQWKTYRTDALADLEKGLKLSPKQPQAFFVVARLSLLPPADVDKAVKSLDKTISLAKDDAAMRAKALLLRSALRKNLQDRVADLDDAPRALPDNPMLLRARGLALAEQQKWQASLADFDKSIAAEPGNVAAYQLKAAILVKLNKLADALATLEKAHKLAPEDLEIMAAKAEIYNTQSNHKAAVEELTRALAVDRSNLALLGRRADAYERLGDKTKALADIDRMLELKSSDPEILRARAALLADMGKFAEAAEVLQKIHKANPNDALTTLQIAMLYTTMKQYEKAIAAYDEVLTRSPDEVEAIRGRGDALLNLGRRGAAVAEYEKAFKLKPHDFGILNNYAWVLATAPEDKLRDGHRALEMAIEACKQTEYKKDYILSTLAAAYAETGDFGSARKWAAKAVEVCVPTKDEPDRKDELQKELESYKADKPWREALVNGVATKVPEKTAAKKENPKKKPAPPEDDDI